MGKPGRRGNSQDHFPSTKGERRGSYRDKMSQNAKSKQQNNSGAIVIPISIKKPIVYLNERQRLLGSAIRSSDCAFAIGPAGTGKTHVAIAERLPWLFESKDNMLVLTNPATEIGEKLGTLPGDKDDKIAISTRPLRDILNKLLGASHVDNLVANGRILFEPLGSILGTTFDNATIIFDEAQNSTPQQMKALLTRVGHNSKIVIAGDYKEQKFIEGTSGLEDAIRRLRHLNGVGLVEFTPDDIVRSGFCKDVILAYRNEETKID